MIPFAFLRVIHQQALIKKGYVFQHSPFQEMSVPSLSHCNHFLWARKLQTKACLFLPSSGSAEKEIQLIFMRLCGISCFIVMKEKIVSALQSWNMWHQEMVWCCYSLVWKGECLFLAGGISDGAVRKPAGQNGRSGEKRSCCLQDLLKMQYKWTHKNNNKC